MIHPLSAIRTLFAGGFCLLNIVVFSATASAGPIMNVAGSTLGCFGAGCASFTSSATSDPAYALTFTGNAAFTATTDSAGSAANINLGSLARANQNTADSTPAESFTLQVTFTLPSGISGGQSDTFTATINGTNSGGGGALAVNFDNSWQLFNYSNATGSGSFEFSVSDLSINKNSSGTILGGIRNASFIPTESPTTTPVPEPATLTLLASGAAALAVRRRRSGTR